MTSTHSAAAVNRRPAGTPVGGQFAETQRGEADVDLGNANEPNWGTITVQVGSRTPWGRADHIANPAPGIAQVGTPGHGGVKLSPERNAEIPPALRNSSGWYEEDCEVHIVAMHHPEAFPHYLGGDLDAIRADGERGVVNNFPDAYEKATGKTVTAEESSERRAQLARADRAAFRAAHSDEFVSTGWGTDSNGDWVPEDYTVLQARIDDTGETRDFLVPNSEGIDDHRIRDNVVIDPKRHVDVTGIGSIGNPPPKVDGPALTGDQLGISTTGMSSAGANQALGELHKRFRFRDDNGGVTIETYGEHMARVGVTGKRQIDSGCYVEYGGGRVSKINKGTFEALTGVPDTNTPEERAAMDYRKARESVDRAEQKAAEWHAPHERQGYIDRAQKARERTDAAMAALDTHEAAKTPWADRQTMRREALDQLLASKGIEL